MLRRLLSKLKVWLGLSKGSKLSATDWDKTQVEIGDQVGNVKILTQSQVLKRTHMSPGDSYQVGEAVVTLHKDKASMLAAIAAVDAKREAKWLAARERAIDLMMLTPEELAAFKVDEWLEARNKHNLSKVKAVMGPTLAVEHHGKDKGPLSLKQKQMLKEGPYKLPLKVPKGSTSKKRAKSKEKVG